MNAIVHKRPHLSEIGKTSLETIFNSQYGFRFEELIVAQKKQKLP